MMNTKLFWQFVHWGNLWEIWFLILIYCHLTFNLLVSFLSSLSTTNFDPIKDEPKIVEISKIKRQYKRQKLAEVPPAPHPILTFPHKPPPRYAFMPNTDPRCSYPRQIIDCIGSGYNHKFKQLMHNLCAENVILICEHDGESHISVLLELFDHQLLLLWLWYLVLFSSFFYSLFQARGIIRSVRTAERFAEWSLWLPFTSPPSTR